MSNKKELQQWALEELERIEKEDGVWMAYIDHEKATEIAGMVGRDIQQLLMRDRNPYNITEKLDEE